MSSFKTYFSIHQLFLLWQFFLNNIIILTLFVRIESQKYAKFLFKYLSFSMQVYSKCSCLSPSFNISGPETVRGFCDRGSSCDNYIILLVLLVSLLFIGFMTAVPNKTVVLRWDNCFEFHIGWLVEWLGCWMIGCMSMLNWLVGQVAD